jgi:hypothetical protein
VSWGIGIPVKVHGHYESQKETLDNLRFLTMRITLTLPISRTDWIYDVSQSDLNIEKRSYHSGKPLKLCGDNKLFIGIMDPKYTEEAMAGYGQIVLLDQGDRQVMSNLNSQWQSVFQTIINNIVQQILKTRESLPVRSF